MLIHDPVDLSGQNNARLVFDVWYKTQTPFDVLEVAASTDGINFSPLAPPYSGDSSGWITEVIDMSAYAGQPAVHLRFYFSTNSADTDLGVFVDNVRLDCLTESILRFPLIRNDPPPPPAHCYFDDFSDRNSGWPEADNTWNHQDCWKWFYSSSAKTYNNDICDDRTDVKVSPLVRLPSGSYSISADARFRTSSDMWWTAYGILFDAKDDPNPSNPDLGDYYMLWVLWEGTGQHLWKILKDVPGDQEDLTPWRKLDGSCYNYGGNGTAFNNWRIVRTAGRIKVYVNGHRLADIAERRPTTNNQIMFGLYGSTYETTINKVAYDNFVVDDLSADAMADLPYYSWDHEAKGVVSSGEFELEHLLPSEGVDLQRDE